MPRSDERAELIRWFAALEEELARLLGDKGPYYARAITRDFFEQLGGLRITVPTIRDLIREERDRRICAEFRGDNHSEIAIRHGMTVRQIRRILRGK